jgi:hypothetical protein
VEWPTDRSVLFHSLPRSKRYPEIADEYAELLHRHLTLLNELVGGSPDRGFLVITRSWSESAAPVSREPRLERMIPARYLRSDMTDPGYTPDPTDPTDEAASELWEHSYATYLEIGDPALVALLVLVSNDEVGPVDILPADLSWSFQPYDGGVRICARTAEQAVQFRSSHLGWLPAPESEWSPPGPGLFQDEPSWQFTFANLSKSKAQAILSLLEERDLVPSYAHLVDPQRDLTLLVDRRLAQILRAALSIDGGDVLSDGGEHINHMSQSEAQAFLVSQTGIAEELDDFISNYGYRYPSEAVGGELNMRLWDERLDYEGIRHTTRG